jgi:hypothetical protein
MIRFYRQIVLLLTAAAFFSSCKKNDDAYSETPEIEFISVSSQHIRANHDSLVIIIAYKDGDGDLGENDTDAKNLFVRDNRNNVTYKFRIKQLAPDNAVIAIKGQLAIVLQSVPLVYGSAPEQVAYEIYLTDRKGNRSNTVRTSVITVSP